MLTVVRYITIMLCALALSLGLAEALAATPDPSLLRTVAALLSAAAVSALSLAILLRNQPGFGLAVWGTLVLTLAGIVWAIPEVPGREPAWLQLLPVKDTVMLSLLAWVLGFSLVVLSAIRQPPVLRRGRRGPLPLLRRIVH